MLKSRNKMSVSDFKVTILIINNNIRHTEKFPFYCRHWTFTAHIYIGKKIENKYPPLHLTNKLLSFIFI